MIREQEEIVIVKLIITIVIKIIFVWQHQEGKE